MKRCIRFFISSLLLFSLSGCADVNSNFQCPLMPGVHCKSLDQINRMVSAGELGRKLPIPAAD